MGTRNPNRASSIYLGANGNWHGRVTVGYRDDGSIDRRHVESKSKATVVARVRRLERDRDSGNVRRSGQRWTVESWLQHWLANIARPSIRESSFNAYRVAVNKHLIPGLGKHGLAMQRPNGARWAIALALGLRQGEAAGLRWADVDLETRSLRIQGTRPHPVYGHGCGGTCGRNAGFCPKRLRPNPEVGDAKSQPADEW